MTRSEVKVGTDCNNNCIFCLNGYDSWNKSTEQIIEEINLLKKQGISEIQFTGGEPTIRKDFFYILRYAKNTGFNISIQTNGRMFSYKDYAKRICDIGISSFLVSLHSHNENLNFDITKTKNAFEQTIEGIKNLVKNDQNVIINCVVNKKNSKCLKDIIHHHSKLKPDSIQLSWCRPQGKVKNNIKKFIPKFEDCKKIKNFLNRFKSNTKIFFINIPLCLVIDKNVITDPYKDSFIISKNELYPAKKIFTECYKEFSKKCMFCKIKNDCGGVLKGYIHSYGDCEFISRKH